MSLLMLVTMTPLRAGPNGAGRRLSRYAVGGRALDTLAEGIAVVEAGEELAAVSALAEGPFAGIALDDGLGVAAHAPVKIASTATAAHMKTGPCRIE
jgi:hypothetical protein